MVPRTLSAGREQRCVQNRAVGEERAGDAMHIRCPGEKGGPRLLRDKRGPAGAPAAWERGGEAGRPRSGQRILAAAPHWRAPHRVRGTAGNTGRKQLASDG